MSQSDSSDDPLGLIADAFVEEYRRGQRPSIEEYARRHPQLAEQIREVFPTLLMVEDLKCSDGAETSAFTDADTEAPGKAPARLGDYRILREVGRGGMGIVYEAEQESLGRHVALKVLPSHALLDPKHLKRFRREARAAARLHHTNIVPVYGVGEEQGAHYIVMQYIAGQGLDQVIAELSRIRGEEADSPHTKAALPTRLAPFSAADAAHGLLTGAFNAESAERREQG